MTAKRQVVLILAAVIAVLGIVGCTPEGADLEGKTWQLVSYGDPASPDEPLEGREATAEFSAGQVSGSTGCNQYSGGFEASGDELSFGPIAVTEMACMEPPGIMQQERDYLKALMTAERYETQGDQLKIFYSEGQVLSFQAQ